MTNAAIELHDSHVVSVRVVGSDVVIDLDAYVHVSDGVPGVDAGTGWARPVRITVRDATLQSTVGDELLIYDGAAHVGSTRYENMLPLELDAAGDVHVELTGGEGMLRVRGTALHIEPTGEAKYIERVGTADS